MIRDHKELLISAAFSALFPAPVDRRSARIRAGASLHSKAYIEWDRTCLPIGDRGNGTGMQLRLLPWRETSQAIRIVNRALTASLTIRSYEGRLSHPFARLIPSAILFAALPAMLPVACANRASTRSEAPLAPRDSLPSFDG